jgi:predicted DNA-binding transcriptional regulator YafY
MNRIDRLTAILIQLQTKRVVRAEEIADHFAISLRTVYRDVKALMEAGVPIGSEAGKGYFIVDGYHLPPVMFTQDEASAMMMAGKLVEKFTDDSIRKAFESALNKIKAVLSEAEKDHLESLQDHIEVLGPYAQNATTSGRFLSEIRKAVVDKRVLQLSYISNYQGELTERAVEPIGLFYYSGAWHLIGWCRLRNGMRDFRTDRLQQLLILEESFKPRNVSTLQEYFNSIQQANADMQKVIVLFDKKDAAYVSNSRYYFGFVSEEETEEHMRMVFLASHIPTIARWLLSYGASVEVVSPDVLKHTMTQMVEELASIYLVERSISAK